MNKDLALAGLKAHLTNIEREGMEAGGHFARWHHRNTGNIDGLLYNDRGRLGHHAQQIKCWRPSINLGQPIALQWLQAFGHLRQDSRLHLRPEQCFTGWNEISFNLVMADDLHDHLSDLALTLRSEYGRRR